MLKTVLNRFCHCLRVGLCPYLVLASLSLSANDDDRLIAGAGIFADRCVLCHGNRGMGDGILTLLIEGYPSANLLNQRYGNGHDDIVENIRFGGMQGKMSLYSPPWENELSLQEIRSVALFVGHLYEQPEAAAGLLDDTAGKGVNDIARGKFLFLTRCAVCHGDTGRGDGKLAGRVIKNPAPFDLTLSVRPQEYIVEIIRRGGAEMSRSGNMPPWEEEFTRQDIGAIAAYLMTLRSRESQQAGDV